MWRCVAPPSASGAIVERTPTGAFPRTSVWVPGEFRRMACRALAHRLAALAAAKSVQA
jgi:hypothetical protein